MLSEPKQSNILCSWRSCAQRLVQCLLCVWNVEPLHQRADGRKSSGYNPLTGDGIYSSGIPDIPLAVLAVTVRDGATQQW